MVLTRRQKKSAESPMIPLMSSKSITRDKSSIQLESTEPMKSAIQILSSSIQAESTEPMKSPIRTLSWTMITWISGMLLAIFVLFVIIVWPWFQLQRCYEQQTTKFQTVNNTPIEVFSLDELNKLDSTYTHVIIHALRQQIFELPHTQYNPGIVTADIGARDMDPQMLIQILNNFPSIKHLALNVGELSEWFTEEIFEGSQAIQPIKLDSVAILRLVGGEQCARRKEKCDLFLKWISSWRMYNLKRLILCNINLTDIITFSHMQEFLRYTNVTKNEIVLQNVQLCNDCIFFNMKLPMTRVSEGYVTAYCQKLW